MDKKEPQKKPFTLSDALKKKQQLNKPSPKGGNKTVMNNKPLVRASGRGR
jgi:hypothetical protein